MLKECACSNCCSTGSGCRVEKVSAGNSSSGTLLTVAVAAAVTMFAAPGPMEDAQAMIFLRSLILANAVAACAMPCSFFPWNTFSCPGSSSSACPSPTTMPCPNTVKIPSTNLVSLPSKETYWLSRNFTSACAVVMIAI